MTSNVTQLPITQTNNNLRHAILHRLDGESCRLILAILFLRDISENPSAIPTGDIARILGIPFFSSDMRALIDVGVFNVNDEGIHVLHPCLAGIGTQHRINEDNQCKVIRPSINQWQA